MTSYVTPKKNVEYIFYLALPSAGNLGLMQANPTLAAGDVKVSIDGGAFANLGTLPVVTPAAGKAVKVTLSLTEMNGDNIVVVFSDQTNPAEWLDIVVSVQTTARQIDDLAFPTVSGRGLDVSAGGEAGVDWANVGSPTTAQGLTGTTIATSQVVASVTGAVGSVTGAVGSVTGAVGSVTGNVGGNVNGNVVGSVGSVTAAVTVGTNNDKTGYTLSAAGIQAIWDRLTAALTTVGSIGKLLVDNIDATISSRLASASYTTPPTATQNADALLTRDLTAVAAPSARSPMNAIRKLMNRVGIGAGTLTVYQEDDATPAYTQTITQDAAQTPIKELDTN